MEKGEKKKPLEGEKKQKIIKQNSEGSRDLLEKGGEEVKGNIFDVD